MGYFKKVVSEIDQKPTEISVIDAIRAFLDPFLKELGLSASTADTTSVISEISEHINIQLIYDSAGYAYIGNARESTWTTSASGYGYKANVSGKVCTCHAVLSKNKNVLSVGISPSYTTPPYLTETIVKYGDNNFLAIQHGAYITSDKKYTLYRDFYVDSSGRYVTTSPQLSLWYRNDDFVAMVPAINPWTNEVVPDLYLATIHPSDTTSIRQQITVGNRTFISGLLHSHAESLKEAPLAFIEI